MVSIFYSETFLHHETEWGHPESPERLRAIVKALRQPKWASQLRWKSPTKRSALNWILLAHTQNYIEQVQSIALRGGGQLGPDTSLSSQSYEAACLAVTAWVDAVDEVLTYRHPAFVLARPPGHHALRDQGMGFCIFGNAAIAALYALKQPGIDRVAILDWDVHHGNGTQAIVENNPQIAYCSLHQYPFYPGTGAAQETGPYQTILNIPMRSGSTVTDYEKKFHSQVMPFLRTFNPDLLIVSAGFDANQNDPLAEINLQPQDYGQFTTHCLSLNRPILFGLEGGYDLESLATSVEATIAACLNPTDLG
jgi:acetoin utilization deacetylase AcuC-like enzyme